MRTDNRAGHAVTLLEEADNRPTPSTAQSMAHTAQNGICDQVGLSHGPIAADGQLAGDLAPQSAWTAQNGSAKKPPKTVRKGGTDRQRVGSTACWGSKDPPLEVKRLRRIRHSASCWSAVARSRCRAARMGTGFCTENDGLTATRRPSNCSRRMTVVDDLKYL
jgi:hypothetical protein